ncbi:MAG: hypothetical protein GX550_07335 [Syntrophomonadaceae bacterium]|nr:hypothetical protein [Syntrophomonadaceae bacterium]
MRKYQICQRCIMDTSDPEIVFDEKGICNHCKRAEQILGREPYCLPLAEKEKRLKNLAEYTAPR